MFLTTAAAHRTKKTSFLNKVNNIIHIIFKTSKEGSKGEGKENENMRKWVLKGRGGERWCGRAMKARS